VDQVGEGAHGHTAIRAQRLDDPPVNVIHRCHMSMQAVYGRVTGSHMAKISRFSSQYISTFVGLAGSLVVSGENFRKRAVDRLFQGGDFPEKNLKEGL
jgi:hypothetical protein